MKLCPACKRSAPHGCKRRDCPGYMDLWLGDNRIRVLENVLAHEGDVVMTTVTPPGMNLGGWDEPHCEHRGAHVHSGAHGCRAHPVLVRHWNQTAAARFSRMHRAAWARVYRRYGKGPVRLAYAPEPQKRGLLHWHVILAADTPFRRHLAQEYVDALAELAPKYGFGNVDRGRKVSGERRLPVAPAGQKAAYVSKYLVKDAGYGFGSIAWTLRERHAPPRMVYVNQCLTKQTRCTMRNLRARRNVYRQTGRRVSCAEAERLTALYAAWESLHRSLLCRLILKRLPPSRTLDAP